MPSAKKSFTLGEHFNTFVEKQVEGGRFNNASEVVRAGLRLLENEERHFESLRLAIAEGDADLAAGRVHEYASEKEMLDDILDQEPEQSPRNA